MLPRILSNARVHSILVLLSILLQRSPSIRLSLPGFSSSCSVFGIIVRWTAGATAIAGSFHTMSGATTLVTGTSVEARSGETFSHTVTMVSTVHGTARSYQAIGVAPTPRDLSALGISMSAAGVLSGAPTRAGTFSVRVTGWERSNFGGHNASRNLTLIVKVGAVVAISQQPSPVTVKVGGTAVFSVTATGSDSLTYQWLKNDQPIPDATASTLSLPPATLAQAGDYSVRVSLGAQTVTSAIAKLTVLPFEPPVIVGTLRGMAGHPGDQLKLLSQVTGDGPFIYQWFKDGIAMPGQTAQEMSVTNLSEVSNGDYEMAVSNAGGTTRKILAQLKVAPFQIAISGGNSGQRQVVASAVLPQRNYQLRRKGILESSEWELVKSQLADAATLSFPISSSNALEFFRVQTVPVVIP